MLIPYFLLSGKDSNPHRRNQNPKCYHYTTGQICFASAKLRIYFGTAIANLEFFIRFNLFLHIYPFNGNADSMTAYDFFHEVFYIMPFIFLGIDGGVYR